MTKNTKKKLILAVACALIDRDGRVLISERPKGKFMEGYWEFPGGKIDDGETPEQALIRELKEELAIDTEQSCLAPFSFISHAYESFHLLMPVFFCRIWQGQIIAQEQQEIAWVFPKKINHYQLLPSNQSLCAQLDDWL